MLTTRLAPPMLRAAIPSGVHAYSRWGINARNVFSIIERVLGVYHLITLGEKRYEIRQNAGESSAPFINPDLGDKWSLVDLSYPWCNLKRGMIVGVWSPYQPGSKIGKRIVALQGDEVTTRGLYPRKKEIVPYGHVWLEGDNANWRQTEDSNSYGPVPVNLIRGRVVCYVWPTLRRAPWVHEKGSRVTENKMDVAPKLHRGRR